MDNRKKSIYHWIMGNPKREAMLARIQNWHEHDEHEKILDEIDLIPREFWDYDLTCIYARALNNNEQYEDAIEILMSVKNIGVNDSLWNFRTGYSLYYLGKEEEASYYIKKAIDLGDLTNDARELLMASIEEAKLKNNTGSSAKKTKGECELLTYKDEEYRAVEKHIEKHFGPFKNVFHEVASPDIHVDIAIVEPTRERNYYTLVTIGMGSYKMKVPHELKEKKLDRAELLICLPPDWKLDKINDEKYHWPVKWLKILARIPQAKDPDGANTWLGWGHTIPGNKSFAENTRLSGLMLIYPGAFGLESFQCKLNADADAAGKGANESGKNADSDIVNFYQIVPLYGEELDYKLEKGAEALLELMDDVFFEYVKIDREAAIKIKKY